MRREPFLFVHSSQRQLRSCWQPQKIGILASFEIKVVAVVAVDVVGITDCR